MRLKFLISEFKRNWLIATIGLVLHIIGIIILNINEGRAMNHSLALNEALSFATSFKDDSFHQPKGKSKDLEGKLIHVIGPLRIQEPVADATYNIQVQAVKLRKIVQMYQWHEDFTENKFSETEETSRNYFYYKDWNEHLVDSRSFHSLSHQNPRQLPMHSKLIVADKVFINNFEIGEPAKELFTNWIEVTSDTRPEDSYIKMHLGWYYHVEDLFEPQVGDVRVKFQFAGLEGNVYTFVGKVTNGKIQPYKSFKKDILLLAAGELTIDEIFKQEHHSVRKSAWIVRGFGFILIFFGVICLHDFYKIFSNTKLSFLAPDPSNQFKSNVKNAAIIAATVCVLRQSLHYAGVL